MKRNIITIAMKRIFIIFSILMSVVQSSNAQSSNSRFTIIDYLNPQLKELTVQINDESSLYVVGNSQVLAPDQITSALTNKHVEELHIYVSCKPGSMVFMNTAITTDNIRSFATALSVWKNHISKRVVIHNLDVFQSGKGAELKSNLEQITGLNFASE